MELHCLFYFAYLVMLLVAVPIWTGLLIKHDALTLVDRDTTLLKSILLVLVLPVYLCTFMIHVCGISIYMYITYQ